MTANQGSKPKLSEQLAEDIHAGVDRTFLQMFGMEVKSSVEVFDKEFTAPGDVSGIVPLLMGEQLGSLVVTFPQATLFAVLKAFYKKDFTEIDRVAGLAVGEITNIVFGVFKHRVGAKGFSFSMAIPNVAVGSPPRMPGVNWTLHCKFTTKAGDFSVLMTRVEEQKA